MRLLAVVSLLPANASSYGAGRVAIFEPVNPHVALSNGFVLYCQSREWHVLNNCPELQSCPLALWCFI